MDESHASRFDPFTIAGMCAVGAVSSLNLSLGLVYGRTFAAMFKDFGNAQLPAITILELSPFWHLAWAAVLVGSALAVPFLVARRTTRLVFLGTLVAGGLLLVGLFFV